MRQWFTRILGFGILLPATIAFSWAAWFILAVVGFALFIAVWALLLH